MRARVPAGLFRAGWGLRCEALHHEPRQNSQPYPAGRGGDGVQTGGIPDPELLFLSGGGGTACKQAGRFWWAALKLFRPVRRFQRPPFLPSQPPSAWRPGPQHSSVSRTSGAERTSYVRCPNRPGVSLPVSLSLRFCLLFGVQKGVVHYRLFRAGRILIDLATSPRLPPKS